MLMHLYQTTNLLIFYTIQLIENLKVYSYLMDNMWRADLADMQIKIRCNKTILSLFCVIDAFSKYTCVIPLKNKKI